MITYRASWICVRCLRQTKTMAYGGVREIGDLTPTGWVILGNEAQCLDCARAGAAASADDRAAFPASASPRVA